MSGGKFANKFKNGHLVIEKSAISSMSLDLFHGLDATVKLRCDEHTYRIKDATAQSRLH